jgi:hypothetical protein
VSGYDETRVLPGPDDGDVRTVGRAVVDDIETLMGLNLRFIEAFRRGSWELLQPILTPSFSYLDGDTGEVWTEEQYVEDLRNHALPALQIDQVVVHVDGDIAVVSARSSTSPERHHRYIDTYLRGDGGWRCMHACVWPLSGGSR